MPARTVPTPTKRGKRSDEHRDEQLLNKASETLMAISANVSRKQSKQPPVPNTMHIFCDMLYGELMSIADVLVNSCSTSCRVSSCDTSTQRCLLPLLKQYMPLTFAM